jgi:predicted component of type VI protein secretion system
LIVLTALVWLAACSGKEPPPDQPGPPEDQHAASPDLVVWNLYPRGLTVNFLADAELNQYDGQANSVMICLYQLKGGASFASVAQVPDGVETLFKCEKFDPTVVSARRLFIQPGGRLTEAFDRLEGTSVTALAVGYMTPSADGSTCQAAFPIRKTMVGLPFFKHPEYSPDPLTLDVRLGPDSISCRPRAAGDPDPFPAPAPAAEPQQAPPDGGATRPQPADAQPPPPPDGGK